ncbi:apiosidase-like domain-containing protein [Enterococcus sp. LJL128]
MKITVNQNKRTLLREGKHFFYFADTCWSVFTSIREEEWLIYLKKRQSQGFNTLQINILPQWDRSRGSLDILPYTQTNSCYDFSVLNEEYFKRAEKLCQIAEEHGFTLALVVLWSNYVAGTWASELDNRRNVIPKMYRQQYFEKVVETFDQFSPIYLIGGDTDFPIQETIDTYIEAFDFFEKASVETLKTIHIKGRLQEIPEEIRRRLAIYLYQSGHNRSFLNMPYALASHFYQLEEEKPIINSEPCYEQMGFARKVYGRFSQRDVRQAAWQSVLSGGAAGITYGAHGIWSWHGHSAAFAENIGEAFDRPMHWQDALQFPGANDYGFMKQLFEMLHIKNLIPCNQLLVRGDEQIRLAETEEAACYLIYIPSNTTITVSIDLSEYQVILIDLKENCFLKPEYEISGNETTFDTHRCLEDVLIIAYK